MINFYREANGVTGSTVGASGFDVGEDKWAIPLTFKHETP